MIGIGNWSQQWLAARSVAEIRALTPRDFAKDVFACVNHLRRSYLRDGMGSPSFATDIVNSIYANMGYKLARLQFYLKTQGPNIAPQKNDTEDSLICLHLNTLEDSVLVTNEPATVNAVRLAMVGFDAVFREIADDNIRLSAYYIYRNGGSGGPIDHWLRAEREYIDKGLDIKSRCRAMSAADFLTEVGGVSV